MAASRIAIIGGGIAGLAAAHRLAERAPAHTTITVYESAAQLGGKLRTGTLAGGMIEYGAEAFLTSDPAGGESAAVTLARAVGLGDDLVHPATTRAAIAVNGALHPIPGGTLVGVPGDLAALPPLVTPRADLDAVDNGPLLGPDEDISVGALVRARLGDDVADRLVDPILGGVYAGRADDLSITATMPGLARACRSATSLVGAVQAAIAALPPRHGRPIFTTIVGGLSQLIDATAAASGARIVLGQPVRELHRTATGWQLTIGPTIAPQLVDADAVILALPARPAARLLADLAPTVAADVGALDYASVALVTLALPAGTTLPELSGLLAPAGETAIIKAATFFGNKWAHHQRPDGTVILRASVGRYGDEHTLQRPDDELVTLVHKDLSALLGPLPAPIATHVQRWGGALPQYPPGHHTRIAAARTALAAAHPTLALAGAGYDGVGIPICIKSGQQAADAILRTLGEASE